jgi:triosephosphate isomerase (TIM)
MTNSRKPLMAGNWKMNINHLEAVHLVQKLAFSLNKDDFDAVDVAVIPPFTDLRSVQTAVQSDDLKLQYGSQDISAFDSGAYTGEISGVMLQKLGCTYAVVGHSERRQYHNETDTVVNAKAKAAIRHGLVPIVCVGEPLEVRKSGTHVEYTLEQTAGSLADFSAEQIADLVVAYEPVWAIGTGEVATPEDAQEVCSAIRTWVKENHGDAAAEGVRVLYGGSVKASNIASIMEKADVDGALIGGASLDADEFVAIARFRMHPADN